MAVLRPAPAEECELEPELELVLGAVWGVAPREALPVAACPCPVALLLGCVVWPVVRWAPGELAEGRAWAVWGCAAGVLEGDPVVFGTVLAAAVPPVTFALAPRTPVGRCEWELDPAPRARAPISRRVATRTDNHSRMALGSLALECSRLSSIAVSASLWRRAPRELLPASLGASSSAVVRRSESPSWRSSSSAVSTDPTGLERPASIPPQASARGRASHSQRAGAPTAAARSSSAMANESPSSSQRRRRAATLR